MRSTIGIIGLDAFSIDIATKIAHSGTSISLFHLPYSFEINRALDVVFDQPALPLRAGEDWVDFIVSIESPRKIFIHLTPVIEYKDEVINTLLAICTPGDRCWIIFDDAMDQEILKFGKQKDIQFGSMTIHEFTNLV